MTSAALAERPAATTRAALTYIIRQDEKPYFLSSALTGGEPEVHFRTEQHTVPVRDLRPIGADVDREGFELLREPTAIRDFYDADLVDVAYNAEVVALLKRRFGASAVYIFDHTRRSDSGTGAKNPDGLRGPATRVHCDYTDKSGPQRARDAMGAAEYDRVLAAGGRVVQINVWRPITGPVRRAPLALAAANSVPKADLIATDQRFPDRTGEIYQLAYAEGHDWYYAPLMTPDEVLLIKGWDSADGRAKYTPHGAFQLPDQDPSAPPRESIETRTFLVIEPA
ncbi:MAG: methyltransferase [Alphaproteobacteria bacterium]|nr:methyltransferase [Alphaproteobacteria bacterium]MCB9930683.1 methyltransferase [Alphaproteobacteria bacterium]